MILAKPAILMAMKKGRIRIAPFCQDNLQNSSYDVTLGPNYYVEQEPTPVLDALLNPYDEASVHRMWGPPLTAERLVHALPGIPAGSQVIFMKPGQNILAHTNEFIGGADLKITTMLKARSSIGRSQITICRCAGWGDIGFCNRFVLEISNNGLRSVVLVVGRRIGQVVFLETTGVKSNDAYFMGGKYQSEDLSSKSLEELTALWKPETMLPRMWKDVNTLT